jgi:hypothetical protein
MKSKTLFMGTTKIAASKTASEIVQVLVDSGARQIGLDYGPSGSLRGLQFVIPVNGNDYGFKLPVRIDPLLKHLRNDREQAERVAWRQLLRWCQAQFALIDVGMVRAEEVYAPYQLNAGGQTPFEALTESKYKLLEAGRQ